MCNSCRNPLQCIIAPEMVENIKIRGTKSMRRWANELEEVAREYRSARRSSISPSALRPESRSADAPQSNKFREVRFGKDQKLVRKEGDPKTGDSDIDTAYDFAGTIYDFFFEKFKRDSIDGEGLKLNTTVRFRHHARRPYNNAFWDDGELKCGEGDGKIFKSFAEDLSIFAHEYVHGVIHFSGGLKYEEQAGALNESIADVFASLIVQYHHQQKAHEASWLIGQDVLINTSEKVMALRSLKAPGTAYRHRLLGTDSQPYHMDGYVVTNTDNGGVHLNSGIPNYAFYLLAIQLGGFAWEKAGKIWYNALVKVDNPLIRFEDWAALTVDESDKTFGRNSRETLFTKRAWKLVGINVS